MRKIHRALVLCLALIPSLALAATSQQSGQWNDPATWGGALPGLGEEILILAGHKVTCPTHASYLAEIGNVQVFGELECAPIAGVVSTFRFPAIDETAVVGATGTNGMDYNGATDIGIWVREGGVLDIRGAPKTAWTRLAGAALQGADQIVLEAAPTGWRIGDTIVIVPTEHPSVGSRSWTGTGFEEREVTAIDGATITLIAGLEHDHPAVDDPFDPAVTHTAEVLNLTRNVRIEGTGDGSASLANNGRAHITFLGTTQPQTISYVELRHMGPRKTGSSNPTDGVPGRYPLHFHHAADGSRSSVVEGVVVRQSGNRAFVPHGSHGITFRDVIAYDVWEDPYWWDASSRFDATNNTHDVLYDRAVAALVKDDPAFRGYELAGFKLESGAGNAIRDSVAIGVQGNANASGFHWPSTANLSEFNVWDFSQGNVAHNNKVQGIFTWQNDPHPHVVSDFVGFRNGRGGVDHGAYANHYQYIGVSVFDNGQFGLEEHAGAGTQTLRPDGYSLAFEDYLATEPLIFQTHGFPFDVPALFLDCAVPEVIINDGGGNHPTKADFVNCTRPDGTPLAASDFAFQNVKPGMEIRLQDADCDAVQIDTQGGSAPIATFYDCTPPPPPCPNVGDVCQDGTVRAGEDLYAARCDEGQAWNGTACAGTRAQLAWSSALTACSGQAGFTLPVLADLQTLYGNRVAIGGFRTNGPWPADGYWSATETSATHADVVRFSSGAVLARIKTGAYNVRCVKLAS